MTVQMRHLIVLLAFLWMLLPEVRAWGEVQSPAYSFRSTSSLQSAGSSLPMAAVTGGGLVGDRPAYIGGIRPRMNAGREDGDDDDIFDDENITHTPDPDLPVGDGVLPLLLMAAGYALWIRRRTTGNSKIDN
jgi:hypothetical protein